MLLHKEWKILKEFEGTDKVLEQKLRAKLADKRDVDHRVCLLTSYQVIYVIILMRI